MELMLFSHTENKTKKKTISGYGEENFQQEEKKIGKKRIKHEEKLCHDTIFYVAHPRRVSKFTALHLLSLPPRQWHSSLFLTNSNGSFYAFRESADTVCVCMRMKSEWDSRHTFDAHRHNVFHSFWIATTTITSAAQLLELQKENAQYWMSNEIACLCNVCIYDGKSKCTSIKNEGLFRLSGSKMRPEDPLAGVKVPQINDEIAKIFAISVGSTVSRSWCIFGECFLVRMWVLCA